MTDEKTCFVISPIGEPDSDTRKRADQILKHVVKPAVGECGYTAVRADEIDKPGIITSQVIQRVVTDPLVIADLTERNPNVFYELAIRHALRKPLVQLIKQGRAGSPLTLRGPERSKSITTTSTVSKLRSGRSLPRSAHLRRILPIWRLRFRCPSISRFCDRARNQRSGSLADLVSVVAELRAGMAKLDARIGGSEEDGILDEIKNMLKSLPRRLDERLDSPFRRLLDAEPSNPSNDAPANSHLGHMGPRGSECSLWRAFSATHSLGYMIWVLKLIGGFEKSVQMRRSYSRSSQGS